METTLSLPGTSLLYCIVAGTGLVFAYFILPDTDGRTLEEIEEHFCDNTKKITDRKIAKAADAQRKNADGTLSNK